MIAFGEIRNLELSVEASKTFFGSGIHAFKFTAKAEVSMQHCSTLKTLIMKKITLILITLAGIASVVSAQSAGDYRSVGTGNWNTLQNGKGIMVTIGLLLPPILDKMPEQLTSALFPERKST